LGGTEGAEWLIDEPAVKKARPAGKKPCVEGLAENTPPFRFLEKPIVDPLNPETHLSIYGCDDEVMGLANGIANSVELEVRPPITVFGKQCRQPRDVGFFSNESTGYKYSGQTMAAQPLTDAMSELLSRVNGQFGTEYNGILINRYENGYSNIGKHSDNENGICPFGGVISISVGATRIFRVRDKESNSIEKDILTVDGQLIQMAGEFQKVFTHEIPVERTVVTPRYSFTFRRHEKEEEVVPKRTRVRKSGVPKRTRVLTP
jgi:alkylated DNA repair dioxygenase AlkB